MLRQDEPADNVYFLIQGEADVLRHGEQDKNYLDHKAIYNDMAINASKTKANSRLVSEAKQTTN